MIGTARTDEMDGASNTPRSDAAVERAESEFHRARADFAILGEDIEVARCDRALAQLYTHSDRTEEAITALKSALSVYETHRMVEERSECARQLAISCARHMLLLLQAGRHTEADDYGAMTQRYCEDSESWEMLAEFWEVAGALHLDRGRYGDALAVYSRARDHHRRRGSVVEETWCEMHGAMARLFLGDGEDVRRVLARALDTFKQASDVHRYQWAVFFVAKEAQIRSDFETAMRSFAEVSAYADEIGDEDLRAQCSTGIAEILTQTAHFDSALAQLTEAGTRFESEQAWLLAAYVRLQAAQIEYLRGQFSKAEELVEQARLLYAGTGATRNTLAADLLLGRILLESGRQAEAEEMYRHARETADRIPGDDVAAEVAAATGTMHYHRREFEAAGRAFAEAGSRFRQSGNEYAATVCDQNLAILAGARGDYAASIQLTRRACRYYESNPPLRWKLAGAYRVLAALQSAAGQYISALWSLQRARTIGAKFELKVELANIDIAVADTVVAATHGRRRRSLPAALKWALPATLYMDSMRLTFSSAASRIAWRGEVSGVQLRYTFDWVRHTEDATLMADLIEVTINSGVHTATAEAVDQPFERLDALLSADPASVPDFVRDPPVPAEFPPLGGAAALISGVTLPMRPPPRLLMPDRRIALGRYLELADRRYGAIPRPPTVRTW